MVNTEEDITRNVKKLKSIFFITYNNLLNSFFGDCSC